MKNSKIYEAQDKMISLIKDDYNLLQALGSFGITLGFGDKSVEETCRDNGVDTYTFLAVVNMVINGYADAQVNERIKLDTLLHYLQASHSYYLDFQLPFVRKELNECVKGDALMGPLIMKLYEGYAREIRKHMRYEEKTLFPYINALQQDKVNTDYNIEIFSRHHAATDQKLRELKLLIIKYLPSDPYSNNRLTATLYYIYNNEEWLKRHALVEDRILVPTIQRLESKVRHQDVTSNIHAMVFKGGPDAQEALSDREKDVVIAVVQGMSNKEIADHLFISVNTVTTHRRNIARKLQIHSSAGLTIYAIVNGLVDISSVKL